MRLNTQYYEKKKNTSKSNKKKKSTKNKGPKLLVNYSDMSEYNIESSEVDLTQLRYGMIESCNVKAICLDDEYIDINNSWIGLLMLMIQALMERNLDNFVEQLGNYEITNQFFCVDKVYGKYTFSGSNYKAYKIGDTEYYLESTFETPYIFSALVGLTQALDIKINKIKFVLKNKNVVDFSQNFNLLSETEEIVDITHVKDKLKSGIHMVAVEILGVKTAAHRIDVVLYLFCNWVFENYGQLTTLSLSRVNNTGINLDTIPKGTKATPLINSGGAIQVFTDSNSDDIVDFIILNMKKLNMDKDNVKIKFRSLKDKKDIKEYEVD